MVWRVRIPDEHLAKLDEITTRRQRTKRSHGVATQKYDRKRTDWEICYFGFMGEVGVALSLCETPDWSVLIGGDNGTDITVNGQCLQVKTPLTYQTRDWFYFNDEERFVADYGVLCNVDEYETSVLIRGAVSKEDFLRLCVTKNFGYGERVALHATQMSSMDDLIAAIQAQNNTQIGERC